MTIQPLFDEPFLRAQRGSEFEAFQASPEASALLARLQAWGGREQLTPKEIATVEAG